MAPLRDLNAYFDHMEEIYVPIYGNNTQWKNYKTQVELNHALIVALMAADEDSNDAYVTKLAFDSVETVVNVCLEDWPAAIGSVFSVIKDIVKVIGLTNGNLTGPLDTTNITPLFTQINTLASAIQDLNTRITALENNH